MHSMPVRSALAIIQLAVFVGGGVVAPVAHLAAHRPDHTHGPGGWIATFRTESSPHSAHRHPHAHPHPHEREGSVHAIPSSGGPGPGTTREPGPATKHDLVAHPLETTHGHGSLVHFGLALLSAPPLVPLPVPALTALVEPAAPDRAAVLFHPVFPLPRPPPSPSSF
jgi:hypothetical protein